MRLIAVLFAAVVPLSAQVAPPGPQNADAGDPAADVLAVQVRLDRLGFSPGEIDGAPGRNTTEALAAFQRAKGLQATGTLDGPTAAALGSSAAEPALTPYTISAEDLGGPFVPEIPEDLMAKASLPALGYTSLLEMLGERFHASPRLLQRLNPAATFASAGEVIQVPNVGDSPAEPAVNSPLQSPDAPGPDASVVIAVSKRAGVLTITDAGGALVFHAPVTVGSEHDPLPIGEWTVTSVTRNPLFNYNPDLFWDADPSHAKARIQAGPNSPVGLVWIALSREHYGIHGTPEPGRIGHTESHGCVRLTNWDALRVAALARRGTRVVFTE